MLCEKVRFTSIVPQLIMAAKVICGNYVRLASVVKAHAALHEQQVLVNIEEAVIAAAAHVIVVLPAQAVQSCDLLTQARRQEGVILSRRRLGVRA